MRASVDDEELRRFLQERTGRFALVIFIIGIIGWSLRLLQYLSDGQENPLLIRGMGEHLASLVPMLLLYLLHRSGKRSVRLIRATELFALVLTCASLGLMVTRIPLVYQPDSTVLLVFSLLLLTRSVYVPSDWRSTAVLALAMGLEVGWIVHSTYHDPPPEFIALFLRDSAPGESLAASFFTNALTWWVMMSIVACSMSYVIYGLRRQVERVRQLGQYTLVRELGAGGVGVVYEARHALLRRPTAVKLLQPDRINARSLARFEKEVRAAAALQHPNTVTVFDYGRTPDDIFYYAMELVPGGTLTRLVEIDGPLPAERVLALMHQIAGGLAGAHAAGLIHRDVKPDNVLLAPVVGQGEVAKLLDFGLVTQDTVDAVQVTQDDAIVGTPQYMSPEMIRGDSPDARCDLYALGAVGYFLLTGEHVFVGKTIVEMCAMHLNEVPESPSSRLGQPVPGGLEDLVLRLLEKSPNDRPQSALAVRAELEGLKGFDAWNSARAAHWWNEHGAEMVPASGASESLSARTVAVDLAGRGASGSRN